MLLLPVDAQFAVSTRRFGMDNVVNAFVGVAIVRAPGATLDDDGLRAFLDGRLAKFKIPERIWFMDDGLPRNANGKFVKRELRDMLIA